MTALLPVAFFPHLAQKQNIGKRKAAATALRPGGETIIKRRKATLRSRMRQQNDEAGRQNAGAGHEAVNCPKSHAKTAWRG
ncbi:hypothetical protein [Rhodobacter capsulatus]|uniref:hypothetical protein n=1 Tax=Rhodobacter capsulatus TaxID=1061 RepID=UPI004028A6AF